MSIAIRDQQTERLVRDLARRTGESLTEAVKHAALERLQRVPLCEDDIAHRKRRVADLLAQLDAAREQNEHLTDDELLGYDASGLPS